MIVRHGRWSLWLVKDLLKQAFSCWDFASKKKIAGKGGPTPFLTKVVKTIQRLENTILRFFLYRTEFQDLENSPNFCDFMIFSLEEIVAWNWCMRCNKKKVSSVIANHFLLVYISFLFDFCISFNPNLYSCIFDVCTQSPSSRHLANTLKSHALPLDNFILQSM
jgi:hypothetical protein